LASQLQVELENGAEAGSIPAARSGSALHPELAEIGFMHLRDVVPLDAVQEFRALARAYKPGDNVHRSPIFEFLIDRLQVQKKVQALLNEQIHYYGWCTVMPGSSINRGYLHDDAKGCAVAVDAPRRILFDVASARTHDALKHPTWPIYRLFIYLNDHDQHSGGTKLRAGSHRRYSLASKQGLRALRKLRFDRLLVPGLGYRNPRVKAGDAILFNLKCKHSALYVRLRAPFDGVALPAAGDNFFKQLYLSGAVGRGLSSMLMRPFHEKRTSVIIDFCTDSDWSRGYQLNRMLHANNQAYFEQFADCNKDAFGRRMADAGIPLLRNPLLRDAERFMRGQ